MSKTLLLIVLLNFVNFSVNGQNKENEPLMNLDIYVNGEKFQIKEGDTLNVSNTQIIVRTSDLMTFDYGILKFDYPKYFSFSLKQEFAYNNWTLDGVNFVIMYFEFGAEIELDMLIKEMVKKFGKKNCVVNDIQTQIGDSKLNGKRIIVSLLGQKLTYDMYKLESNDFMSHFLAFQDSKKDDGTDSDESIKTMKILNQSLRQK